MTANGKHGSVQEMLQLEEFVEGVLCLRGGDYRAVIPAQSVNFALKSEEEQEAVMAAYRSFLNSLSHPVQMLVRILATNVEPYLAGFRTNVTTRRSSWSRLSTKTLLLRQTSALMHRSRLVRALSLMTSRPLVVGRDPGSSAGK